MRKRLGLIFIILCLIASSTIPVLANIKPTSENLSSYTVNEPATVCSKCGAPITGTDQQSELAKALGLDLCMHCWMDILYGSYRADPLPSITFLDGNGLVPATSLGTGSDILTKFLRGDQSWVTVSGGTAYWGDILGTLSNQLDLDSALDAKQNSHANLTSLAGLTWISGSPLVKMTAANTFGLDTNIYLTSNQNITLSGDLSGSGTTSISGTVTGIQSKAITLATGFLKYSGTAWVFDNSTYLTGNQSISLTGAVTGSGTTSIATTLTAAGLDNVFASNGLLKRTGTATYTLDTNTYLTGNQSISLSSDASGSGATSIAVTNTGLKGVALPTLATGYLYYNGSAWAFQTPTSGSVATDIIWDTKGDLAVGTGADAAIRLASSGVNNQVLTIDTTTATGLKWAAPAGGDDSRIKVDAVTNGEQHDVTASVALTNVAVIDVPLTAGTYVFRYDVIYQSNQLTNGIRLAVNYTGTSGAFVWNWRWIDLSATASTAVPDQDQLNAAGSVNGGFSSRAKSTTTRGVTLSVDTINANMYAIIEGVFVATGAGDLELWHGSELSTAGYTTSVMVGTSVVVTKTK